MKRILYKEIVLVLGMSLFFSCLIFAGSNKNASIVFDLNDTVLPYHDVRILEITGCEGQIDPNDNVVPNISIENIGTCSEVVDLELTIEDIAGTQVYYEIIDSIAINAGEVINYEMPVFTPEANKVYTATAKVILDGDQNPFNNIKSVNFNTYILEREMVILEIFTSTDCYYCPGAAMGAEDLIANDCDVAVVEYHSSSSDPFYNTYASYRKSYYGVSGIPHAFFDGILDYVGGSHTQSLYSTYLPIYVERTGINSAFAIDIAGENTGLDYDVTVTVNKVAQSLSNNIVLQVALTESNISYSWQGQSELNFVERLMVPDQYGTPLDFSTDSTNIVNLSFTLDAGWVADNCELAAFIQDNDSKEILQGSKLSLTDLPVDHVPFSESESVILENYPNPFNSTTTIHYAIKGRLQVEPVEIRIYNVTGQLIETIEARNGTAVWNVDNLPTGVYLYQLETENYNEVKKMLLIR